MKTVEAAFMLSLNELASMCVHEVTGICASLVACAQEQ